jgi:hypothetical protein
VQCNICMGGMPCDAWSYCSWQSAATDAFILAKLGVARGSVETRPTRILLESAWQHYPPTCSSCSTVSGLMPGSSGSGWSSPCAAETAAGGVRGRVEVQPASARLNAIMPPTRNLDGRRLRLQVWERAGFDGSMPSPLWGPKAGETRGSPRKSERSDGEGNSLPTAMLARVFQRAPPDCFAVSLPTRGRVRGVSALNCRSFSAPG